MNIDTLDSKEDASTSHRQGFEDHADERESTPQHISSQKWTEEGIMAMNIRIKRYAGKSGFGGDGGGRTIGGDSTYIIMVMLVHLLIDM